MSKQKKLTSSGQSALSRAVGEILDSMFGFYSVKREMAVEIRMGSRVRNLRFDFYVKAARLAVECQGSQHFLPNKFFYDGTKDFKDAVMRDEAKRQWCEEEGVTLVEFKEGDILTVKAVEKAIKQALKKGGKKKAAL